MSHAGGRPVSHSFWSYSTTLPPVAVSASDSRRFVRSHLSRHQLEDLCDDVELVASELATNAIRHAATDFALSLQGDGASVLLTVHDQGAGVIPAPNVPEWSDAGGRGLLIAQEVSDDWGVTRGADGHTLVWACFEVFAGVG